MLLLFLLLIRVCLGLNIASWWVGDMNNPSFQLEQLNWEAYTHIHYGGPINDMNGKAYCNKTDYNLKRLVDLAHIKNVKVMWGGGGMPLDAFLWDHKKKYMRDNYLGTIKKAMNECNIDGISPFVCFKLSSCINLFNFFSFIFLYFFSI